MLRINPRRTKVNVRLKSVVGIQVKGDIGSEQHGDSGGEEWSDLVHGLKVEPIWCIGQTQV